MSRNLCLITPSYKLDFERCRLLVQSVAKYSQSKIVHYLIVDSADRQLFKQLENSTTVVISKEEILPSWLIKLPIPGSKNIWLSFKSLPVRGWLIQQIVKLEIANHINEDVLVFADSDVFFVKDFDLSKYIQDDGRIRFFAQPGQVNKDSPKLANWYHDANQLLNLPEPSFPASNYMGQLIFWNKENVLKLHRHIEEKSGKNWIKTICDRWNVSEYILYGVFVEQILKEEAGHYIDERDICHNYWLEKQLETNQLQEFFNNLNSDTIAAMLSAKANIPVDSYLQFLET